MGRIELTDTMIDAVVKMAEGNPGAVVSIMGILDGYKAIDPHSALGGFGAILSLDDMGIYGTAIYVLSSDKCGKDLRRFVLLLRANQLGFLSTEKIQEMAADQSRTINLTEEEWKDIDAKVCDRLPEFARPDS